ncbi:MAG: hypothetical protein ACREOZ_03550 [Gloeomargaritales cyanobacterium]
MKVEKCLQNLDKEDNVFFMSVASNKKIQLFHNASIIGGSLVNPELKLVALAGFSNNAIPIEIDLPEPFGDINVTTPTQAAINKRKLQSVEAIEAEKDVLKCKRSIVVPPFIAEVIMNSENQKPSHLIDICFVSLLKKTTGNQVTDTIPENTSASRETLDSEDVGEENEASGTSVTDPNKVTASLGKYIIQFLWAASQDSIEPVTYTLTTDPLVLKWSKNLHIINIFQGLPSPSRLAALPSYSDLARGVSAMHHHIERSQIQFHDPEEYKRPGFKKLSTHVQRMFLFASSIDGESAPENRSQIANNFCRAETLAQQ